MTTTRHTPGHTSLDYTHCQCGDGDHSTALDRAAHQAEILHRWNAHPAMIEALKNWIAYTDNQLPDSVWLGMTESQRAEYQRNYDESVAAIRAAEGE